MKMNNQIFIDRRRGNDRRLDDDPCRDLPMDIYHRKRRKSIERRHPNRTLLDDYLAYLGAQADGKTLPKEKEPH